MDMSKAALPARYGYASRQDEKDPLFPAYQAYRSSMSAKLVDSADFRDWKRAHERDEQERPFREHPRLKEFQDWMAATRGGLRACPAGDFFPQNFKFWLDGGRW